MPADLPAPERLYLKDFQAVRAGGEFHVPPPLADDWLNSAFDLWERTPDGGARCGRKRPRRDVPCLCCVDHAPVALRG